MPRIRSTPMVRREFRIPEPLALQVELFLPHDPITGKVGYGEWSLLVEKLLNRYLNERSQTNVPD